MKIAGEIEGIQQQQRNLKREREKNARVVHHCEFNIFIFMFSILLFKLAIDVSTSLDAIDEVFVFASYTSMGFHFTFHAVIGAYYCY